MTGNEPPDLVERLTNLGHLSSGVGHNVINAFAAIVSSAELLRLDPPVPAVADPAALAETIINAALEASTVARRLIDYTRPVTSIETGQAAFRPADLALDALVEGLILAEKARAPAAVRWETRIDPIPPMRGHPAQLRSMIMHLLNNAYEAMRADGQGCVRVSTSTDARGWNVLEVRDDGLGMDGPTLERSVEPFFSTKPGHAGVGLSVANGIWRRHRGTLSVQSRPGQGTCIRLCVEPTREGA